ncbi:F-box protein CPR1-like [Corylus avellana]|uniref:F-box protein CPR1-like n=1 Tax=Corylus avellana TaxID=13451 RepID=UPI00286A8314|nr:F-box protein CPR1-like [Corylus avellana]
MTNILPQELITEILSLLLVKPLLRFQCVSKAWFVVINDPDFIKMHLNRSIETNRERALIADANNAILPQTYYSVNFSDKQQKYKKLPFKPIEIPDDYVFKVAFGYDQINDNYKVVRILKPRPHLARVAEVGDLVYSLGGNSWRKVEDKWPRKDLYLHMHRSASLNGALHWVADRSGLTSAIIAFDLSTEKFRVHALPIKIKSCAFEYNTHLVVLGGCLCVWEANCEQFFDVWVMKEYGVAASNWRRLYRLPHSPQQTPSYSKPLALSNSGEEVLMHEFSGKLYCYNIKKKRSRIVEIQKRIEKCELNLLVVGSLLLLDGMIELEIG